MSDQFATLDTQINQLKALGIEGERFETLVSLRGSLMATLNGLDHSVEQKLDLEQTAHGHFQRLIAVQDELQRLAELAESRQKPAAARWLANAEQSNASLFGTFGITQPSLLDAARLDIEARLSAGDAMLADLGGEFAGRAGAVQHALREIATGPSGLLATRAGELAIVRQIGDALSGNKAFADRFDDTAATVSRAIENDILGTSSAAGALIERQTYLVAALSLFCVCGAGLILSYVRRSVIQRLRRLQEAMQGHVVGQAPAIETGGNDELADMASALEFFVRTISEREAALAASGKPATLGHREFAGRGVPPDSRAGRARWSLPTSARVCAICWICRRQA